MIRLALLALAFVLLAAACSGHERATRQQPSSTAPTLTDLQNIGQLRSLFNTRSDQPRLILLVSPT
jgi:hypothetical protein